MIKSVPKKYRILEVVKEGKRSFFPQERWMYFFWVKIVEEGYTHIKEEFNTIEEAKEFLYARHKQSINKVEKDKAKRIAQKDDSTVVHNFDAVFYKLKNK